MHRRTGGTGDDSDGAGIFGQGLFVSRVKQALGRQLFLQLLKGGVQVAYAVHGHGGAVQLIRPVPGVDRDLAHGNDLHAVVRPKAQTHGIALEHDTLQGRPFVFQRKIVVPRWVDLIIADLAPDGHLPQKGVVVQPSTDVFG